MASRRTTILLDDETRLAASELARRYGCSVSEAIRRAVIRQRNASIGVPPGARKQRTNALERLFELFERNDPGEEVSRLKQQDEHF